jgi:HAD superfamily hydrolase (TIGR01509 family)
LTAAVTIDFHDTLFLCDDWFTLEVRDLPLKYLNWQAARDGTTVGAAMRERAVPIYRELRLAIIESGIEIDAVENIVRVCETLGLAADRPEIALAVDELMNATLASAAPRPGVLDFVTTLKAAGIPLGIVSNAIHEPFLEWAVEAAGMHGLFDSILTSARAGYYKSRPEIYLQAASELGVAPEEIIHIGDSPRFDVEGAAAAGMRTVWLDLGHEQPGEVQPDLTVTSFAGLADILFDRFQLRRPDAL